MKKMRNEKGFTLIEIVMVIVLLGILAAVAIPRFVDLSSEAQQAAVEGMAGSAGSAMAINYAGCVALGHVVTANKCVNVDNCDDAPSLVNGWDAAAVVTAAALGANGTTASCTVTYQGATATFTGIGAGQ